MPDLVDRLAALWTRVPAGDGRDEAAFRELYTDPVTLNGVATPIGDLVRRHLALHAAFEDIDIDVVDRAEMPGALAVVLRQQGRHAGALPTPLGTVPPTGRRFEVLGIDVLTLSRGRISRIWVVADELGRLAQLRSVRLAPPPGDAPD